MPTTITRTAWTDDDGSGTTGTIINNAEKTTLYNQIDALLTADPTIFTSIAATSVVGTWGNRIKYDGANLLFIGVPGTTTAKKITFVDSAGNGIATIDGVGNGLFGGSILSTSPSGGVGYTSGAGGSVAQSTSKATGVTLNKVTGKITMFNDALAGGAKVSFVVTNSTVLATDVPVVCIASGGTANAYRAAVTAVAGAGGTFTVTVENITGGSLSEAPVVSFAVIKGVIA